MNTILLLILALLRLAPIILEMIRDKKIKDATTKEIIAAFQAEFDANWGKRVDDAVAAGERVHDNVTPEGNTEPDPFDRASTRKVGGK